MLDDARRYYPEGEKAAQVLGSVGVDNNGLSGLEQQLDDELRGADGEQRIVKDARGDAGLAGRAQGRPLRARICA